MSAICIHQTPGRLRLRSAAVKNDKLRAQHVTAHLSRCEGVRTVEANPLTGSVLVCFHPPHRNTDALLHELRKSEQAEPTLFPAASGTTQAARPIAAAILRTTVRFGAEQIAEKIALLLLAAVLA